MKTTSVIALSCLAFVTLQVFASCPQGDIVRDCVVDPSDLAALAGQWMAGKDRPANMVLVKGGAFRPDNGDTWVQMPDYLIGRYEVTNAEYAYFLNHSQSYSGFFYDDRMSILRSGELGHYSFAVV